MVLDRFFKALPLLELPPPEEPLLPALGIL